MHARSVISSVCTAACVALAAGCASGPAVQAGPRAIAASSVSIALPQIARTLRMPSRPPGANGLRNVPSGKWIYTAQLYGNDAGVYRRNGFTLQFLELLTIGLSAPQGTIATPSGWWYVANGGHSNVLVYRTKQHGPVGPLATLDDYGQIPANVAVTPSRKVVAVSNVATTAGASGSVSIYLKRQAEPARILTYGSDQLQGIGIAIDHHGNCYWSFNDAIAHNGSVVEFAGCAGTGRVVVPTIGYAGGLTFDQHENLFYVDQTQGIFKCRGLSKCTLFATGFGDPVNVNFDLRAKELWVADATGYIDAVDARTGRIDASVPAAGGASDPPFGIAPAPGE